jgi:K+-transporting ATPase KdpF subunit
MTIALISVSQMTGGMNLTAGYIIAGIIALIVLGYLFYSLIDAEKF